MGRILIENIELYANHGHFREEQVIGSNFVVNVELDAQLEKACESDDLSDTFDYRLAYEAVFSEMKKPSALLENVASRIADRILKESEIVRSVKVKLSKMDPPIGGSARAVTIEIERRRKQ